MCRFMMKSGTYDASCPEELVHLCYANALAGLQRRPEALLFLERACARRPEVASWALMHAKMLFVEDRKEESLARCLHVIDAFARGDASTEEAADAFHLAGWVHIHADDHSAAYALWARGHATLPEVDDPNLRRQTRKRLCWDVGDAGGGGEACEACLLGEGWGGVGRGLRGWASFKVTADPRPRTLRCGEPAAPPRVALARAGAPPRRVPRGAGARGGVAPRRRAGVGHGRALCRLGVRAGSYGTPVA